MPTVKPTPKRKPSAKTAHDSNGNVLGQQRATHDRNGNVLGNRRATHVSNGNVPGNRRATHVSSGNALGVEEFADCDTHVSGENGPGNGQEKCKGFAVNDNMPPLAFDGKKFHPRREKRVMGSGPRQQGLRGAEQCSFKVHMGEGGRLKRANRKRDMKIYQGQVDFVTKEKGFRLMMEGRLKLVRVV